MPTKTTHLPKEELNSRGFKTVRTPYFSIKLKKNSRDSLRIGVIAGKAASPTAVGRNFLKRQARGLVAKEVAPGRDVLVIFSPAVRSLTKRRLKEELSSAAKKAQQ